jgi:hypothetical protein
MFIVNYVLLYALMTYCCKLFEDGDSADTFGT